MTSEFEINGAVKLDRNVFSAMRAYRDFFGWLVVYSFRCFALASLLRAELADI